MAFYVFGRAHGKCTASDWKKHVDGVPNYFEGAPQFALSCVKWDSVKRCGHVNGRSTVQSFECMISPKMTDSEGKVPGSFALCEYATPEDHVRLSY